jgi:hypothetical protein
VSQNPKWQLQFESLLKKTMYMCKLYTVSWKLVPLIRKVTWNVVDSVWTNERFRLSGYVELRSEVETLFAEICFDLLSILLMCVSTNSLSIKTSVAWVREWTIPTERPPLVGEVPVNFRVQRVLGGQPDGSLRPYYRTSRPESLHFLPNSTSIVLTRLSEK